MLRSLIGEVVRRRLWPIPLAAILIAVAAPLLFMKSAPVDVPADAAPVAAAPGELSTRAQRLVATSDQAVASRKRSQRRSQDPFAPPASATKAKDAAAGAPPAAAPAATGSGAAGAVVIKNSDGSTSTMPATKKQAASKKKASTAKKKQAPAAKKKKIAPKPTPAPTPATVTYVDVRFGERKDTGLRYRVPRLQTFRAGGKVAAMFVKYSPARDKAVFAIAPSTYVSGDVKCRKVNGVCRYVDIPEGEHVRLTLRGEDGRVVSRRLDVVHIRRMPLAGNESAARRTTPLADATCLLKGLLKLPVTLPSISADACA